MVGKKQKKIAQKKFLTITKSQIFLTFKCERFILLALSNLPRGNRIII